jgi:hypothetical protein
MRRIDRFRLSAEDTQRIYELVAGGRLEQTDASASRSRKKWMWLFFALALAAAIVGYLFLF